MKDAINLINEADTQNQIVAVGVNCTAPEHIESLIDQIQTEKIIIVYANKGDEWDGVNNVFIEKDNHINQPYEK